MLRGVAVGGLVAGVRVGKATGVVYLPGLGFMWFFSPGGVGHWAPNLHLRLTLLNVKLRPPSPPFSDGGKTGSFGFLRESITE